MPASMESHFTQTERAELITDMIGRDVDIGFLMGSGIVTDYFVLKNDVLRVIWALTMESSRSKSKEQYFPSTPAWPTLNARSSFRSVVLRPFIAKRPKAHLFVSSALLAVSSAQSGRRNKL